MSTNFPTGLDTFVNPGTADKTNGSGPGGPATLHHVQHTNVNDAAAALQAKVGVDHSQDTKSIDFMLRRLLASGAMRGMDGDDGEDGYSIPGPSGLAGAQGAAGAQGVAGAQGTAGAQGSVGVQGPQGNTGAQGIQGAQGNAGAQGDAGAAGAPGRDGEDGADGIAGPIGPQGSIGAQGPQGDAGAQGAVGAQGPQGVAGAQGIAGPQGNAGAQGTAGAQGSAGASGFPIPGQDGEPGADYFPPPAQPFLHYRRDDVVFDGLQNALTLGGDPFENDVQIVMRSGTATRFLQLSELTVLNRGYTLSYTPANNDVAIVMFRSQNVAAAATILGANDPYFSNVVSLLHFDGANGTSTFTDQIGKTWTATNATLSTGTKKYGTAAGSFNGSNTSVSTPHSGDFDFGSGDFDIECWINPTALPGSSNNFLVAVDDVGGTRGWQLALVATSQKLRFAFYQGGVQNATLISTAAPSTATWTHVCVERWGSLLTLYVGGTSAASISVSGSLDSNSNQCIIGTVSNAGVPDPSGTLFYNGFLDDLRITKGVARYRGNFTPQGYAFQNA